MEPECFYHKAHLQQNLLACFLSLCLKVNPVGFRSIPLNYSYILVPLLTLGMWQEPAGCVVEWSVCWPSLLL